jgi:hypothetical protein
MKDQIVTKETAGLAHKKGFDIPCSRIFDLDSDNSYNRGWSTPCTNSKYDFEGHLQVSAPTQSLLQKWLREKHNILVSVYSNASGYCWEHMKSKGGTHIQDSDFSGPNDSGCWDSYEEALEQGLIESFKLIK